MFSIILAVTSASLMLFTAYLGMHVTLHPAETENKKLAYKLGFWTCGVLGCILIGVQTYESNQTQIELVSKLDKIQHNTEQPPKVQVNVPPAQVVIAPGKSKPAAAILLFSFPVSISKQVPITVTRLPLVDGIAKVKFTVKNTSPVPAINPELWVRICGGCSYAKGPDGFTSGGDGFSPKIMSRLFALTLNSETFLPMMAMDITPPVSSSGFAIAFQYACNNCGRVIDWQEFSVLLDR